MPAGAGTQRKWTYEDLLRLPDDGRRHEIIGGAHVIMPSPSRRHQAVLGRLHLAIGNFLASRSSLGQVYLAPFDVLFSPFDVVQPDLLFVAGDQLEIVTEKNVQGAPALVIEILSNGTRQHDERAKRRLYARGGVREYWVVDVDRNEVTVHRRVASRMLCRVTTVSGGPRMVLTTALLPEFMLSLDELFG